MAKTKAKVAIDEPNTSSDDDSVESSLQPPSSPQKQGLSLVPNTPVTLKTYTEVPASFEMIVNNEKILVRGVID